MQNKYDNSLDENQKYKIELEINNRNYENEINRKIEIEKELRKEIQQLNEKLF